jgi:hypothetical protein
MRVLSRHVPLKVLKAPVAARAHAASDSVLHLRPLPLLSDEAAFDGLLFQYRLLSPRCQLIELLLQQYGLLLQPSEFRFAVHALMSVWATPTASSLAPVEVELLGKAERDSAFATGLKNENVLCGYQNIHDSLLNLLDRRKQRIQAFDYPTLHFDILQLPDAPGGVIERLEGRLAGKAALLPCDWGLRLAGDRHCGACRWQRAGY